MMPPPRMVLAPKRRRTPESGYLAEKSPLLAHLEEIRGRLLKSLAAVAVTTAISVVFARQIFDLLKSRAGDINLIYIEMTEMVGAYFQVAFISGLVLAFPFLVYQLVMFLRPGLTPRERRFLYLLLPSVILPFVAGLAFGYFVLIPPMVKFLIGFGAEIATPQIRIGSYISLVIRLLFALGLCFETPLLIFLLAKIGVVSPRTLAKYRKFAFVGAFILGAVITPTFDPFNQCLVAIPLILLYEAGILLAWLAWRKKELPAT